MPQGCYADARRAAAARRRRARRDRRRGAGGCSGAIDGIAHFTVGQRKGLGIAAAEPLYVLRLDAAARRVVVGPRSALGETAIALAELNWLGPPLAAGAGVPVAGQAALGAAAGAGDARTLRDAVRGEAELVLDAPAGAVAPGQAAVLYDGERVLGGGWIRRPADPGQRRRQLDRAPAHLLYPGPARRGSSAG